MSRREDVIQCTGINVDYLVRFASIGMTTKHERLLGRPERIAYTDHEVRKDQAIALEPRTMRSDSKVAERSTARFPGARSCP